MAEPVSNEFIIKGNRDRSSDMVLEDGSRVGVVGGGPAGSFFSFFLMDFAERVGLELAVDIYEPRDFSRTAPQGCNMCGGIISESLVQYLATEGIVLPSTVVQRGIDSYMMHTDVGSVQIETPLKEKRIAAVHRGAGPRGSAGMQWKSFDGHLLKLAVDKGANLIQERVTKVEWENGKPQIQTRHSDPQSYDLLAVATGVNSSAARLFDRLGIDYRSPETIKTAIREFYLGAETIRGCLGNSMHVFLMDLPRLEFAAVIPKGDYATVCMLGEEIDLKLINEFMDTPQVKGIFPTGMDAQAPACQCSPNISIRGAVRPFADRLVFLGDCGVTRLYKDGIGAAYRGAKAAASTAIFNGVSEQDFEQNYRPACRRMETDNQIGKLIFLVVSQIQKWRFARRAMLRMVAQENSLPENQRRMSLVLWDTFTGSAPYKEVLLRSMHPVFIARFMWACALSIIRS